MESTQIKPELTLWGKIAKFFGNTLLRKIDQVGKDEVEVSKAITELNVTQFPTMMPMELASEDTGNELDRLLTIHKMTVLDLDKYMTLARKKGLIV